MIFQQPGWETTYSRCTCLIQTHSDLCPLLHWILWAASRNYYLQGHLLIIKTVGIQMTITSTEDREVMITSQNKFWAKERNSLHSECLGCLDCLWLIYTNCPETAVRAVNILTSWFFNVFFLNWRSSTFKRSLYLEHWTLPLVIPMCTLHCIFLPSCSAT